MLLVDSKVVLPQGLKGMYNLYPLKDAWNLGLFEKREDRPICRCSVPQRGAKDYILPLYSNSIFRKQLWDSKYIATLLLPTPRGYTHDADW